MRNKKSSSEVPSLTTKVTSRSFSGTISAIILFTVFFTFIVVSATQYTRCTIYERENSKFEIVTQIKTDPGYSGVVILKDKDTNEFWITVNSKYNTLDSNINCTPIKLGDATSEFNEEQLKIESYTDCIIIEYTPTNKKYIYFKDSETLSEY